MVKLYKSISTEKIHLVQGGYICNAALGKVTASGNGLLTLGRSFEGTRDDITCKNCLRMLN